LDSASKHLNFFIVPLDCMDTRMIIGQELCLQAEILIGPSGLRVRNLNNLCLQRLTWYKSEWAKQEVDKH